MPAAIAIPAIATAAAGLFAGGAQIYGQHKAMKAQQQGTDQALAYQREQDAERRREFDVQEAARKQDVANQIKMMQWQYQQQAPARAAHAKVLAAYGIQANDAPMPDFAQMVASGAPQGIAPGTPAPGTKIPGGGGGGFGAAALGALGGAAGALTPALMAYLAHRGAPTSSSAYGAPSGGSIYSGSGAGGVGYAMSPLTGGGVSGGVPDVAAYPNLAAFSGYGQQLQPEPQFNSAGA